MFLFTDPLAELLHPHGNPPIQVVIALDVYTTITASYVSSIQSDIQTTDTYVEENPIGNIDQNYITVHRILIVIK